MNPKAIRRAILEVLYRYRQDDYVQITDLQKQLEDSGLKYDDRILHGEIMYLDEKGFLKIVAKHMGEEYLYYDGVHITSYGIDVVEDADEFNKLFSVHIHHFGDVSNSNLSIGSPNSSQKLSISESDISPEVCAILVKLKAAIEKKDSQTTVKLLAELSEGAKAVFWNIAASILINLP